jgi:hypothetical protein
VSRGREPHFAKVGAYRSKTFNKRYAHEHRVDDGLMREAMRSSDARTQRVPVEEALRRRPFGREGSPVSAGCEGTFD